MTKTEENHTSQAIKAKKALISEEIKAFGEDKRDRTADLLNAIEPLPRLRETSVQRIEKVLSHSGFSIPLLSNCLYKRVINFLNAL